MKQYWEAVQPTVSETNHLIERSRSGSAINWWKIVQSEVQSFLVFKNKFLKRYWGEPVQHDIKQKARELDPPILEKEYKGMERYDFACMPGNLSRSLRRTGNVQSPLKFCFKSVKGRG